MRFPEHIDPSDGGGQPDPADVDEVLTAFQRYRSAGSATENLDRDDVEYIGRYLLAPPAESDTWEAIKRWGPPGYGVLKHEAYEIQHLLDSGVNPLDPADVAKNFDVWTKAHAQGLVLEHLYLLEIALRVNPNITFADLVVGNPDGAGLIDLEHLRDYTEQEERDGFDLETSFEGQLLARLFFDRFLGD